MSRAAEPAAAVLNKGDPIRKGDRLSTDTSGALGVTFDDETTFSLSASATMTVDEFVYRPGQRGSATIRWSAARPGLSPSRSPSPARCGSRRRPRWLACAAPPASSTSRKRRLTNVKLYEDDDGSVGRIEIFGRDGARVGELTQAATGYAIQVAGQRLVANALTISPSNCCATATSCSTCSSSRVLADSSISSG